MDNLHYTRFDADQQKPAGSLPLIILHGLFGSSASWKTMARKLKLHQDVITIDLRNHGASPHFDDMSYEIMAKDVIQLLTTLNIKEYNLMGHSMGGKVAMMMSSLSTQHIINKLIIVDIAPKTYPLWHSTLITTLLELSVGQTTSRAELDKLLSKTINSPVERGFILKNLKRTDNNRFEWRINLQAIANNYQNIAEFDIQSPINLSTLFIRGEESPYILLDEDHDLIKSIYPKSIISTIKNSGHMPHIEQSSAFLDTALSFLSSSN